MLNVTDLNAIKEAALKLLDTPIIHNQTLPIIHHPFYDPYTNEEEIPKYKELFTKKIMNADNYISICVLTNKPFRPRLFARTHEYLSIEDFSHALAYIWKSVEFPNRSEDITTFRFMHHFKAADKTILMDEDELKIFNELPDEFTVYRGYNSYGRLEALSWTLDKERAEWFAGRFGGETAVVEAKIKKEYVFAYFSNESEVVINFNRITNLKMLKHTDDTK